MSNGKEDSKTADIVLAVVLLGLSIVGYRITTTWIPPVLPGDPGAAFFPRLALAIVFFFSLVLMFQKFRTTKPAGERGRAVGLSPRSPEVLRFFAILLYSGLLVAGIAYVGFETAAFVFLFGILWWRTRRWVWAFVTSAVAVPIMYFVFVIVLNVRLPLQFLPDYLDIF